MIEHVVLAKFGEGTSKQQKDEVITRLAGLKNEISGLIDLQAGYLMDSPNHKFEIGLTARFTDKAALEAYGPHPKHQEVVSFLKESGLQDIVVADFEIK